MSKKVIIDCFPDSVERYWDDHAIIAIDVIRATTTATTALSLGRRVFPAKTSDEAFVIAEKLDCPLMVGEMGGNVPYGFDFTNSPVLISALATQPLGFLSDRHRPIVLLSSSGTRLTVNAARAPAVYLACARNYAAAAKYVGARHEKIAVIGAGTRGQFRREDQMVSAWVAEALMADGFEARDERTSELVQRWHGANAKEIGTGRSAEYLRRSGQLYDLEFIIHHINDLTIVPQLEDGELVAKAAD